MIIPPDLDEALRSLPTPVATPALACLNAQTHGELASALRLLHSCVHGFLHACGAAYLRNSPEVSRGFQPAFRRAWRWGDSETVVRLHAHLNGLDGEASKSWVVGAPWPPTLAELSDTLARLSSEQAERSLTMKLEGVLKAGMRDLLLTQLRCTRKWTMFLRVDGASAGSVLLFRGPLPVEGDLNPHCKIQAHGGLHLQVDRETFSLEPFCQRTGPAFGSASGSDTGLESGRPSVHVITDLGSDSVCVALPELGLMQRRNDLAGNVWSALRGEPHREGNGGSNWGIMLVRIRKMRELNERFGYSAGDHLVSSIDSCASRYIWQPGALPGTFTAFPFWRRGGELLVPFETPGHSDLLQTVGSALDLAAEIAAAAHATASERGMGPALQIGIRFNVGVSTKGRAGDERLKRTLLNASEELRDHLSEAATTSEHGTFWKIEGADERLSLSRSDPPFTRVSRAAFGLIRRETSDGPEYLLRFNARHGGYNFVGGHFEAEDGDSPFQTLARELREELALAPGTYSATPIFPGPLHHMAFSPAHRASTLYVHHFFAVAALSDTALATVSQPDCRWISMAQLGEFQSHGISPDPLAALRLRMDLRTGRPAETDALAHTLRLLFGFRI